MSLLIPLFKYKGLPKHLEGHRPLRLIFVLRKIHEVGLNFTLERDGRQNLEHFGFEMRISALGAAERMLARVRLRRVISIFLDLTKAYDYVLRHMTMELVGERYRREIAGKMAQLLQHSAVFTQGDDSGIMEDIDRGLTQGSPRSPPLRIDTLIEMFKYALVVVQRDGGSFN